MKYTAEALCEKMAEVMGGLLCPQCGDDITVKIREYDNVWYCRACLHRWSFNPLDPQLVHQAIGCLEKWCDERDAKYFIERRRETKVKNVSISWYDRLAHNVNAFSENPALAICLALASAIDNCQAELVTEQSMKEYVENMPDDEFNAILEEAEALPLVEIVNPDNEQAELGGE